MATCAPPSSRLAYLSQHEAELNAQFHAALKSLINAQPTAPYKFLAEHFAALDDRATPLSTDEREETARLREQVEAEHMAGHHKDAAKQNLHDARAAANLNSLDRWRDEAEVSVNCRQPGCNGKVLWLSCFFVARRSLLSVGPSTHAGHHDT